VGLTALAVVAVMLSPSAHAAVADGGLGARIFANGSPVRVTVLEAESGYTSEIWVLEPVRRLIGADADTGRSVELGPLSAGVEIVFGIRVLETGDEFRTGPGARNPDGLPHAFVVATNDGRAQVRVGFEDLLGGGDNDFNDVLFEVSGVSTLHTPPSKQSCKKGGWRQFADHQGRPFRNQGGCVSYVSARRA
jgi:hypothetical protein